MMIVTIDGPAGTGKTTVAKMVAERLELPYFDTGAMYRAVAHLILQKNIPLSDEKAISQLVYDFDFQIQKDDQTVRYIANGVDVTQEIRSPKVTKIVSPVSAMQVVREVLWEIQRRFAEKQGGVFEGRDMGSVVFPKASIKIFLTAKPEIRAQRRLLEIQETRPGDAKELDQEQMVAEINRRDQIDSTRTLAPLKCPADAYVIDTSSLTLNQVVDRVLEYKQKKILKPVWMHSTHMKLIYRIVLFFSWCVGKLFYRLKIYGWEHYYPRGAILAANHTSFLDPPIVSVSWPEEVHFLARETLFRNRLFGSFIRNLNSHPVSGKAGDIGVMKTICALLNEGKKIVLFPEGTRSKTGELQPFKPGIGMLVSKTASAVIPVYVDGAYRVWGRGKKLPRPFGKVTCVFGSPITWDQFDHLDKKEGQDALMKRLHESITGLKEWLKKGAKGIPP